MTHLKIEPFTARSLTAFGAIVMGLTFNTSAMAGNQQDNSTNIAYQDERDYPSDQSYPDDERDSDVYNRDDRDRNDRMSCNQARRMVRNSGYRDVMTQDCSGKIYMFTARSNGRHGRRVNVYVNARTGRTWRG
jgi:poly(A) polymerase Pap1